jgi:hypothetical protein
MGVHLIKMKNALFFSFICLFSILNVACAQSPDENGSFENSLYEGDVYYTLDKDSYSAGETINTQFSVNNGEDFPMVDAYLVIEFVAAGPEPAYPSQASDADNVFFEEIIRDINIPPHGQAVLPYSYTLPLDVSIGEYRMDAYLKTERTNIVGLSNLFQSPRLARFNVTAQGGFPQAFISRAETYYVNETGQLGPGVDAGEEVKGVVVVKSLSQDVLEGLTLRVSVCEWDDTICVGKSFLLTQDYPVPAIPSAWSK